MAKWKCEICGNEFENFHAQGFDRKIYCPLCYFKKENQELKEKLLVTQTNEETYRLEMEDITQTLGLDEDTIFDDVKAFVRSLEIENQKYKEVIDKAIELLGNYRHYSMPDEKQNSDNEDLVNNAFDILKEVE